MNSDRIEEIQKKTAYPDSISVQQALLQVWHETKICNKICMKTGDFIYDRAMKCYAVVYEVESESFLANSTEKPQGYPHRFYNSDVGEKFTTFSKGDLRHHKRINAEFKSKRDESLMIVKLHNIITKEGYDIFNIEDWDKITSLGDEEHLSVEIRDWLYKHLYGGS